MPSTPGMQGEGYYDQHSSSQAASIRVVRDWVEAAVEKLTLPQGSQPVGAADLGSSEGRNAIELMRFIVERLRRRDPERAVQTFYSDLHSNNFNRLFANLAEARKDFPADVFPVAAPGSFYGPLFPPASVHLITCCNAILWMDHLPSVPVRDFVVYRRPHPPRADLHVSAALEEAFSRQAATDLTTFLDHRARELAPGGRLLVTTPASDEHGPCCDGLYDVLNDVCLDLVAAGRIDRSAYERLTIPVYFRNLAEMIAPVKGVGFFKVERAETLMVPTPFIEEWRATGDTATYAAAYTGFLRAFSEPIVRAAIGDAVEEAFHRVEQRLRTQPERYLYRYVLVAMLLTRV